MTWRRDRLWRLAVIEAAAAEALQDGLNGLVGRLVAEARLLAAAA